MEKEIINNLFVMFENIKQIDNGMEYWSARELQPILGYAQWRNFEKVIE